MNIAAVTRSGVGFSVTRADGVSFPITLGGSPAFTDEIIAALCAKLMDLQLDSKRLDILEKEARKPGGVLVLFKDGTDTPNYIKLEHKSLRLSIDQIFGKR
jgi:hypothetical protein